MTKLHRRHVPVRLRVAAVVLVAVAGLVFVPLASSSQVFQDPTGDAKGGPDITSVTVSDDANGNITFVVATTPQSSGLLPTAEAIYVVINADQNLTTGDPTKAGADYFLELHQPFPVLHTWIGSGFIENPNSAATATYSAGVSTFVINKSELGGTNAFNFYVATTFTNGSGADQAGPYTYVVGSNTSTTPTIVVGKPVAKAPGVHAGKPFLISAKVVETHASSVTITCKAHVGSHVVRTRAAYVGDVSVGQCTGIAPKRSAGKRLIGTITASNGAKNTKAFSFVIRR